MEQFQVGLAILRECMDPTCSLTSIAQTAHLCPDLSSLVSFDILSNSFNVVHLRDRLESLIDELETEKTSGSGETASHIVTNRDPIGHIQRLLPKHRSQIHAVYHPERPELGLISDIDQMSEIAVTFWENVWKAPKASSEQQESFLKDYAKHLRVVPSLVNEEDVRRVIAKTNNSCPGPNGIPFAAYRACSNVAAPILCQVLQEMYLEESAPLDFNIGSLFQLPKVPGTHNLDQFRPISVPNADNRIISSVVREKIDPLRDMLETIQTAFLRGRVINDNIKVFNNKFQDAIHRAVTRFMLLIDFKKAYDNVNHTFLLKVLAHIGVPSQYVNVVKNLLSNLKVIPCFHSKGSRHFYIHVRRGVKQGCPLSPLLFNVIVDTILFFIGKYNGVLTRAFADDIGCMFDDITLIQDVIRVINGYCDASDSEINQSKTIILCSTDFPDGVQEFLRKTSWPNIVFKDRGKYLGVLFGKTVTVADIFFEALSKFKARLAEFQMVPLSLQHRILATNVFLLPIFSYLYQFFLIPRKILKEVKALLYPFLVPYKAYDLELLCSPTKQLGYTTPLKDLEFMNVSALCKQHESVENLEALVANPRWQANRKNIQHNIVDAVRMFYHKGHDVPLRKMSQGEIYRSLNEQWYQDHRMEVVDKKIQHWTTDFQASQLFQSVARIHKGIAPHIRWFQIRLIYNAPPFKGRIEWMLTDAATGRRSHDTQEHFHRFRNNRLICDLCRDPHSKENIRHIFGNCPVVEGVKVSLAQSLRVMADLSLEDHLLLSRNTANMISQDVDLIVLFNYAVWLSRNRCVFNKFQGDRPTLILEVFLSLMGRFLAK